MRKWITRTVGAVLVGAAFVAAGAGAASADSAGVDHSVSGLWDSTLRQAIGPVRHICNDLATPYGRLNPTACGEIPQSADEAPVPMSYTAPADAPADTPADQTTGTSAQEPAPQPANANPGLDLLRNAERPLTSGLQGLGVG